MVDVNLKGTINTVRAALPHMLGREGDVITLASDAGRRGFPHETVYCATKFGQVGFTRASTTSCARTASAARTCAPAASRPLRHGRGPGLQRDEAAEREMMTAEDVAEVVLFVLERPRHSASWRPPFAA